MFKFNRLADYGVLLLAHIAEKPDDLFSARSLSVATHVALPTVSKLLKILVNENILDSVRGKQGGYRLKIQPKELMLTQVLKALDNPVHLTDCIEDERCCELSAICTTKPHLQRINHVIYNTLSRVSLADLTARKSL